MPNLIATKSLTYATRRLVAGDEFMARRRDARLLVAIGKAKAGQGAAEPPKKAKPAPKAKAKPKAKKRDALDHDRNGEKGGILTAEALAKLRADYAVIVGKKSFAGWDAIELQRRIDEAQAS